MKKCVLTILNWFIILETSVVVEGLTLQSWQIQFCFSLFPITSWLPWAGQQPHQWSRVKRAGPELHVLFFFCIFNWRIIALQCCKAVYGLCHVSPWISRKYTYVSSLFEPPSHPISPLDVVPEHRVELPVLYSNFPLALYFTHGHVYVSVLLSQFVSPSPASTVSSVFSMSVSLFLPCK